MRLHCFSNLRSDAHHSVSAGSLLGSQFPDCRGFGEPSHQPSFLSNVAQDLRTPITSLSVALPFVSRGVQ